jgi:GNAT superfamily N-acetyltransferase
MSTAPLRGDIQKARAMPTYDLRSATRDDEFFLYSCYKETLREYIEGTWGWDEAFQVASFLEHLPWTGFKIISVDTANAGAVFVLETQSTIELELIMIDPKFQRMGIGADFARGLLRRARIERRPVRLRVMTINPARNLYERLGFAIVGCGGGTFEMQADP